MKRALLPLEQPHTSPRVTDKQRYNCIIMETVELALKSKRFQVKQWELVLSDLLHYIFEHNMKDDDIKQKFEILIRKEVATLKESFFETFESN